MKKIIPVIVLVVAALAAGAEDEKFSYVPEFSGGIRARFEYATRDGEARFAVRNARVTLNGRILPIVSYKAEIDVCDEGNIKMLEAFVRVNPVRPLELVMGQFRCPFTVDAHRSPFAQYFCNRSFLAKQAGLDIGLMGSWNFAGRMPVTLWGSVISGKGLGDHRDSWKKDFGYSFKAQADLTPNIFVEASCQKKKPGDINLFLYDAGIVYHSDRWRAEGEYMRKDYARGRFDATDFVNAFLCYTLPLGRASTSLSFAGRYDYMSDNSAGVYGNDGCIESDGDSRHRATAGVTYTMSRGRVYADFRINYEQYFYHSGVAPSLSDRDKLIFEVVCRF